MIAKHIFLIISHTHTYIYIYIYIYICVCIRVIYNDCNLKALLSVDNLMYRRMGNKSNKTEKIMIH